MVARFITNQNNQNLLSQVEDDALSLTNVFMPGNLGMQSEEDQLADAAILEQVKKNNLKEKRRERRQNFFKGVRDFSLAMQGINPEVYDAKVNEFNLNRLKSKLAIEDFIKKRQFLDSLPDEYRQMYNIFGADKLYEQMYPELNENRQIVKGADGYNRFVDTGERVFPDVTMNSTDRKIVKGADGYNYYADTLERVLPDVVNTDTKNRQTATGKDGFLYFVDTGERVFPDIVDPVEKPDKKTVFDFKNSLRDDYNSASKEFLSVRDSFSRILELGTAEPSAAGDLALIFNYMKMLDPGSVVRESEFAVAAAAGGYGERAQAAVNQISTGERLSDNMRTDFQNQALNLYLSQLGFQQENENYYKDFAKNNNLEFSDIGPAYSEQLNDKIFDFRVNNTFSLQELQSLAVAMSISPENYNEKQIEVVTKKLKELKKQQNN